MKTKGKINHAKLAKFGINVERFSRTTRSNRMDTNTSAYGDNIRDIEIDQSQQVMVSPPKNNFISGFDSAPE